MGEQVAKSLDLRPWKTGVHFQGGDMRAVGKYLFVGKESISQCFEGQLKFLVHTYDPSYFEMEGVRIELGFGTLEDAENAFINKSGIPLKEARAHFSRKDPYELLEIDDHIYPLLGIDEQTKELLHQKYHDLLKRQVVIDNGLSRGEKLPEARAMELIKNKYQQLFGREVIIVGEGIPTPQPVFHLDMFCTFIPNPEGKPTVIVGDVKEAVKILDGMPDEELKQKSVQAQAFFKKIAAAIAVDFKEKGLNNGSIRSLMKVAQTNNAIGDLSKYRARLKGELDKNADGKDQQIAEMLGEITSGLDVYANWFEQRGFPVKRIPIMPDVIKLDYKKFIDPKDPATRLRPHEVFRSYNNAVIESWVDGDNQLHRTAYMPVFGIDQLDKRAVEVMNSLGVKVEVAPVGMIAAEQGLINCSTSELRGGF